MNKFILKLRILLWVGLALIVFWLLYMAIAPSGKISYVYDFDNPSYFIKKLTPTERLEPVSGGSQIIKGDPVYFSLFTPRRFNKARLTLKYRNIGEMPLIEAGVLADKVVWRYDLKPIENNVINKLSLVWDVVSKNDVILLERNVSSAAPPIKKYATVDDFLNDLPEINQVAAYNYQLDYEYSLSDYSSSGEKNIISRPLRGAYQFYTYLDNEELDYVFYFSDLNIDNNSDDVDFYLYYQGKLISGRRVEDDKISSKNEKREISPIKFKIADLPRGVYKIEVKSSDDIITRKIESAQEKISFINKLYLYEDGNDDITLYSDSNIVDFQTNNPASLQKIFVGEKEIAINETFKQFSMSLGGGIKEIKLEKSGMILAGNGVFSFSEESFINPEIKKVAPGLDIIKDGINYVVARYNFPTEENGWMTAYADFDISNAYRENGKYSFLISIPGLKADDEVNDFIEIKEIRFDLEGTSLMEKLEKIIKTK